MTELRIVSVTDAEHEQRVRSRKYSGPTIPEMHALLRLLDAERARAAAAESKLRMEPGRWWRALDPDGDVRCESSNESEVRESARPEDRVQRLYDSTFGEWRNEASSTT